MAHDLAARLAYTSSWYVWTPKQGLGALRLTDFDEAVQMQVVMCSRQTAYHQHHDRAR